MIQNQELRGGRRAATRSWREARDILPRRNEPPAFLLSKPLSMVLCSSGPRTHTSWAGSPPSCSTGGSPRERRAPLAAGSREPHNHVPARAGILLPQST